MIDLQRINFVLQLPGAAIDKLTPHLLPQPPLNLRMPTKQKHRPRQRTRRRLMSRGQKRHNLIRQLVIIQSPRLYRHRQNIHPHLPSLLGSLLLLPDQIVGHSSDRLHAALHVREDLLDDREDVLEGDGHADVDPAEEGRFCHEEVVVAAVDVAVNVGDGVEFEAHSGNADDVESCAAGPVVRVLDVGRSLSW